MNMNTVWRVRIVTDVELENDLLLDDVQSFLRMISIPRRQFVGWMYGIFDCGVNVRLVDEFGNKATTAHLDQIEREHFDLWLRDWIKVRPPHVKRRIRMEAKERVRLLITMLRMIFPKESTTWGREIPRLCPMDWIVGLESDGSVIGKRA